MLFTTPGVPIVGWKKEPLESLDAVAGGGGGSDALVPFFRCVDAVGEDTTPGTPTPDAGGGEACGAAAGEACAAGGGGDAFATGGGGEAFAAGGGGGEAFAVVSTAGGGGDAFTVVVGVVDAAVVALAGGGGVGGACAGPATACGGGMDSI